jgi:hypothetical protein
VLSLCGPSNQLSKPSATSNNLGDLNCVPAVVSNCQAPNTGIAIVGPVSVGKPEPSAYPGFNIDIFYVY